MKIKGSSIFVFLIYGVVAALLFNGYKHYVDSADLLSYVFISDNYLQHGFFESVNSHWSPLISWLLIPFHFCFEDNIVAFHFMQIVIGFFTLIEVRKLLSLHKVSNAVTTIASILFIPVLFGYEFLNGTPDLLFLTILLFIIILMHQEFGFTNAVATGVLGALLGYSKSFGFVFFILFIILFYAYIFIRKHQSNDLKFLGKNFGITLFTFLLISGFWISVLSIKNHSFTISSATAYNFNIMNPAINPDVFKEVRHPAELGDLTPPEKNNLNFWITPYNYHFDNWTPFQSKENLIQYGKVVTRNMLSVMSFYFGKDAGTIVLILFLFLFFVARDKISELKSFHIELVASVLCIFLYALILVMHRYLWIADTLIFLMFFKLIDLLIKQNRKAIASIAVLLFCITLYYQPMDEMKTFWGSGKNLKQISEQLNIKNARFASIDYSSAHNDSCYFFASTICYYNQCSYYGIFGNEKIAVEGLKQLKQYSIEYLFVFENPTEIGDSIKIKSLLESDYGHQATKNIFHSDDLHLSIYKLQDQ